MNIWQRTNDCRWTICIVRSLGPSMGLACHCTDYYASTETVRMRYTSDKKGFAGLKQVLDFQREMVERYNNTIADPNMQTAD